MREKMIGYSIACCFALGVIYLKKKVFGKKLVVEEEVKETSAPSAEENKNLN